MTDSLPVPPLERLDDTAFERVLVVVAHPDDAEYGTSAAVSMWTDRGIEVAYLLLTTGEAGMQRPPSEAGPLRAAEQRAACDAVGVERLTILDFPDGTLEYGLPLRRAIAREIRAFRPDAVVGWAGDLKVGWGYDHADHRAAGIATIDAIRDAANPWVFPEQIEEGGLAAWQAKTQLLVATEPTHFVEVSDEGVERAVASLAAHEAYLADIPWHAAPEDFVPQMLSGTGARAGVNHAMGFAASELRG